jgi:hypothetical protein
MARPETTTNQEAHMASKDQWRVAISTSNIRINVNYSKEQFNDDAMALLGSEKKGVACNSPLKFGSMP